MKTFTIISVLILVISIILIEQGFHAIDTSHNILHLSYDEKQNYFNDYYDTTLGNKFIPVSEEYKYGWTMVFMGIVLLIYVVSYLMILYDRK